MYDIMNRQPLFIPKLERLTIGWQHELWSCRYQWFCTFWTNGNPKTNQSMLLTDSMHVFFYTGWLKVESKHEYFGI